MKSTAPATTTTPKPERADLLAVISAAIENLDLDLASGDTSARELVEGHVGRPLTDEEIDALTTAAAELPDLQAEPAAETGDAAEADLFCDLDDEAQERTVEIEIRGVNVTAKSFNEAVKHLHDDMADCAFNYRIVDVETGRVFEHTTTVDDARDDKT